MMEEKSVSEKINDFFSELTDQPILKADGFDECIIGFTTDDDGEYRILYSVKKVIEVLKKDMTELEANEYFDYNIAGTKGDKMPFWCYDLDFNDM